MEELNVPAPTQTTPWERRAELGFFKAILETSKQVLLTPGQFFDSYSVKPTYKDPYLYYFVLSLIGLIINTVFQMLMTVFQGGAFAAFVLLGKSILSAGVIAVAIFIGAGFAHLFVMMFGGKGGYKGTFDVIAYMATTNLFAIIPFLGSFVGWIWGIVIVVIGFKRVHRMSTARAVLANLAPVLIVLLIAVPILILAIVVPNIMRAKGSADDALAESTLRTMSTAVETYANANYGEYPSDMYDLTLAEPPYINEDYCDTTFSGYEYTCSFYAEGYIFTAMPVNPDGKSITVSTGGVMNVE